MVERAVRTNSSHASAAGNAPWELAFRPLRCHVAVASIADSAGGYAALTLFEASDAVLTVEFKVNFCAPAKGDRLEAEGRVIKPGRTLTLTDVAVYAQVGERRTLCAKMQQTMMRIEGRPETNWDGDAEGPASRRS